LDPGIFNELKDLEEVDLYDNSIKTVGDALNNLSKLVWASASSF
jgi:protein phosphatase 1 regulatory subunit 7